MIEMFIYGEYRFYALDNHIQCKLKNLKNSNVETTRKIRSLSLNNVIFKNAETADGTFNRMICIFSLKESFIN